MQRTIYVDVDDTLVRSFGSKRVPMPAVIAAVCRLAEQGVQKPFAGIAFEQYF